MSNTSAVIYIVLAIAIGYSFAMPAYNDILLLMDEKQKYEETLATVANIEARKNNLLEQYNAIPEVHKKDIEVLLPESSHFVRLVSQIDSVASKYAISIDNIISRDENPSNGNSIDSAVTKPYETTVIGFTFVASYDKFRQFMDELEKSLRVMDIRTVKITNQEKGLHLYNVEFSTYWFK